MKSIKLTEEHKEKLLEMCKVLFPEYKKIDWYIDGDGNDDYDILIIKDEMPYILIHWFEFCFMRLIHRLQENLPDKLVYRKQPPFVGNVFSWKKGNKWTMYSEFMFAYPKAIYGGSSYPNNPIDYLYKEFKKLKT